MRIPVIEFRKPMLSGFVALIMLISCGSEETRSVLVGNALYAHLSFREKNEINNLIKSSLSGNESAILGLINFPCGGAAGCYDLGFVITQVIY